MGTGPKASSGFDLAMTEVLEAGRHTFLFEVGTAMGAEVLDEVPHVKPAAAEEKAAEEAVARAAGQMGRRLDAGGVKELLYRHADHQRWDDVAKRCLTCANCTMVCPTCFCATVEDVTDLTGEHGERWRKWDSCFTMDFSYHFYIIRHGRVKIEIFVPSRGAVTLETIGEGKSFTAGTGLSPEVEQAVEEVVRRITGRIESGS